MMNTFTISQRAVMVMVFLLLLGQLPAVCRADYSTVIEVENQACMGDDKSRRQTEQEALQNVKRAAAEHARTFVTSETTVQDVVGQPFGTETLVVYAATAPLGPLHLKNLGPVFEIQDRKADIPDRMRGLRIQKKSPSAAGGPPVVAAAEFVEQQHQVITRP